MSPTGSASARIPISSSRVIAMIKSLGDLDVPHARPCQAAHGGHSELGKVDRARCSMSVRFNGLVAVDFERLASDMAASIRLGYEAEADYPNIAFQPPPDDEVRWLADWLVSEGWTRSPNWPRE
jgi:hypothetical protein